MNLLNRSASASFERTMLELYTRANPRVIAKKHGAAVIILAAINPPKTPAVQEQDRQPAPEAVQEEPEEPERWDSMS